MVSSPPALGSRVHCHPTLDKIQDLFQNATNRLENRRPPYSCDGDPAPSLVPAAAFPSGFDVFPGKRSEALLGGSTGEVLPVVEPECGGCEVSWGM